MLSLESFNEEINKITRDFTQKKTLLAVSGGADSMVMLDLFRKRSAEQLDFMISAAHINYKLRGEDSDLDQKLVEDYCEKYEIPLSVYSVSEKDNKPENGSIQLWARELRYRFFHQICEENSINFIATAHHLNDQLETFFINLMRGSGLKGLSGIPANENKILRPLLAFTKEEIYDFAEKNSVPFREDISNKKNDYLRNKIRNLIVLELVKADSNFIQNFSKSLCIIQQSSDFIKQKAEEFIAENGTKTGNYLSFNREKLAETQDIIKFEILNKFGFGSETEIQKIFSAETGKVFFSKDFSLKIDYTDLIIIPKNEEKESEFPTEISFSEIEKFYKIEDFRIQNSKPWLFNKEKVFPPFELRKPKEGDIFQPKGMFGKKKISKFLKDEKISSLDREKIGILCDAKGQILGVFPLRQDGRFI